VAEQLEIIVKFNTGEANANVNKLKKSVEEFADGSLGKMKKSLSDAKKELDKLAPASQDFKTLEQSIYGASTAITSAINETKNLIKSKEQLSRQQEAETNALQAHLGAMARRGAKEGELDAKKYSSIQRNIALAEQASAKEIASETNALQAHLGAMERRGAKEGELDAKKYSSIQRNIALAEQASAKEIALIEAVKKKQQEADDRKYSGFTGQATTLGSINAITQQIDYWTKLRNSVDMTTPAFLAAQTNINNLNNTLGKNSQYLQATTRGSANMGMAILNMNYVIRDSPYFFQNFAMGVMAIGNNLNPMIDSMRNASIEAKAMGSSFGKELLRSLSGGAGITMALSLAVTAFQSIVFMMNKSKEVAKSLGDEYLSLKEKISLLTQDKQIIIDKFREATATMVSYARMMAEGGERTKQYLIDTGRLSKNQEEYNDALAKYLTLKDAIFNLENKEAEKKIAKYKFAQGIVSAKDLQSLTKPVIVGIQALAQAELDAMSVGSNGIIEHTQRYKELETTIKLTKRAIKSYDINLDGRTNSANRETNTVKDRELEAIEAEISRKKALFDIGVITEEEYYKSLEDASSKFGTKYEKMSIERLQFVAGVTEEYSRYWGKQADDYRNSLENETKAAQIQGLEFFKAEAERQKLIHEFDIASGKTKANDKYANLKTDLTEKYGAVKTGKEIDALVELIKKQDESKELMASLDSLANQVGSSLAQAFLSGANAGKALIDTIKRIAVEMAIVKGIKMLLNMPFADGGTVSPSGGGSQYDFIAPDNTAANGYVGGTSYIGDKRLIAVNSGEMILNTRQQTNLFNQLNSGAMSSRIGQGMNININGKIEARQDKFVIDFKKAQRQVERSRVR